MKNLTSIRIRHFDFAVGMGFGSFSKSRLKALALAGLSLAIFSLAGFSQAIPSKKSADGTCAQPLKPGIVVEELARDYPGLRVGLRKGDVLLGWSRGDQHGQFTTPMDLFLATVEQVPRGVISLRGSRGGTEKTWRVDSVTLGASVRPNFCDGLLAEYRHGKELAEQGKHREAIELWKKATMDYTPGLRWLRAWFDFRAAEIFAETGNLARMDNMYTRATQEIQQVNPSAAALFEWQRGGTYYARADYASAEEAYEQAISMASRDEKATILQILILTAASRAADEQGKNHLALSYLLRSKELEKLSLDGISLTSIALATHYGITKKLGKAEQYYRQALRSAEKTNSQARILASLHGLGMVASERGDYRTALRFLERAISTEEQFFSDNISLSPLLEVTGIAARESGDLRKARECFDRSLEIARRHPGTDLIVARNLDHLAVLFKRENQPLQAEKDLHEALRIIVRVAPSSIEAAWIYTDLGDMAVSRGNFSEAEKDYQDALSIFDVVAPKRIETASTLAALSDIRCRAGDVQAASQFLKRSILILESDTANLGGSSTVRAGFRAKHESFYHKYADLLLSQNKPEEAFAVVERSRARTLLEMLNASHVDIHRGADKALLDPERSLRLAINAKSNRRARLLVGQHSGEQIKAVEKEISGLTAQYQDLEAQIRTTSPAYAALTQPQPLTAKQIQLQLLDRDTLLLEYSLGEKRSYVFAVTPDSLHAYRLPGRKTIERRARKVHRLVTAQRTAIRGESPTQERHRMARAEIRYDRAVATLSRMILGPAAKDLKNKRLLVVTDGALAYVPFSLLPEPRAPHTTRSRNAVPLIVHHEIVNLPSASVLAVLREQERQRKPATRAVAVLADPVFDAHDPRVAGPMAPKTAAAAQTRSAKPDPLDGLLEDNFSANLLTRSATDLGLARNGHLALPRLRFTRLEADAIMRVTPPGKGLEAVDFKANRATATGPELSHYRIVHFATHGLLNSEHPELSGLVLSLVNKKGKPQNGFLSLEDIYNLDLPADLVVLSACETGLGKEISGEGVIGLTRGFMYAGASRVVASLWKVSDVATAQLMANFYRAMEKDGLAPAAALRAAQIAMWKQRRWHRPYYWAAFQIQGEWK